MSLSTQQLLSMVAGFLAGEELARNSLADALEEGGLPDGAARLRGGGDRGSSVADCCQWFTFGDDETAGALGVFRGPWGPSLLIPQTGEGPCGFLDLFGRSVRGDGRPPCFNFYQPGQDDVAVKVYYEAQKIRVVLNPALAWDRESTHAHGFREHDDVYFFPESEEADPPEDQHTNDVLDSMDEPAGGSPDEAA